MEVKEKLRVHEPPRRTAVPGVADISREIVRLHSRLYGRGPTRAKTIWRDEIVTCRSWKSKKPEDESRRRRT